MEKSKGKELKAERDDESTINTQQDDASIT